MGNYSTSMNKIATTNCPGSTSFQKFSKPNIVGTLKKSAQEGNKDEHEAAEQVLSSSSILSYNTGHGDFCFCRVKGWDDDSYPWTEEENWGDLQSIRFIELDGFERVGAFDFFQLPKEIRERIFRLLLSPLYSKDNSNKNTEFICVTVAHISNIASTEDPQHIHPARSANYKMALNRDESTFADWIRHASHVSRLFRKELGDALWSRVTINSIQNSDWKHIPAFLKDRPAVHAGIKRIYITVDARDDLDNNSAVWSAAILFPTWCETISKKLMLEHFQILLDLDEDEIDSLLLGTGPLAWTLALRKLRVTRDYRFLPNIMPGRRSVINVGFGGPRMHKYKQDIDKKYFPLFHELLKPDTLRVPQGPRGDVEEYLQSRPQDLSGSIDPPAPQLPWYMLDSYSDRLMY